MDQPEAYPSELEDRLVLPNQRRFRIRPLRRCDVGPVHELYGRLSPRTRYLRFFSPMPVLPDTVMNLLVDVDYRRRLALLVEMEGAGRTEVVALGSFGALGDGSAEVALVVCDQWQRQGIGRALALRVLAAAEARGFNTFVAHALWDNVVIRKLLHHVGDIVSTKARSGVSEIAFVRRATA